ncbi:AAA family ATPase [Bartonella ancashensis]|uniref:ATPase, MoxR family n=1 Tax=Bartonella ancashensis TaxID=1318743 RepID=A0A0M4LGJ4_9HYPH|nr:MoxR family ATPase [Bartonella ancashensis]ALE03569.1 ATPase, MoxR family [Bartonella ancashensis]
MSHRSTLSNSIKEENISNDAELVIHDIDKAHEELDNLRQVIGKVIFGQNYVIECTLTAILAGGHALLIGAPGLAKTRLVETLGTALGLHGKRIQFTPDLMPSDIIGSEIMDLDENGKRSFRYIQGPIFTQLLMADEINRASPRTQSALLQAMQEYHVTVAGIDYSLPQPFHVLATQNPLEQEGTYQLPEAQLDRFLMQIDIDYPDLATERRIILETTGDKSQSIKPVLSPKKLLKIQKIVRKIPISQNIVEAILKLVRSARPCKENSTAHAYITWGPGPRASQALSLCARARALYHGRLSPSLDDIEALAYPVLQHRIALNFAARTENITTKNIIATLVKDAL